MFSASANNKIYKIAHFQFRGDLMNNEHMSLSWFRPLLGGNNPTSNGLILMEISVQRVSRVLKEFACEGGLDLVPSA
jgi:hypothetical protein